MRLLNMNELANVRRTLLAGMSCIGKGTFASVFADGPDSIGVTKVTTDSMAYHFNADHLWLEVRKVAESHFPKLLEAHGDVGESRGATAWVMEVERLRPLTTTAHRKQVRSWITAWDNSRGSIRFCSSAERIDDWLNRLSVRFCEELALEAGPYQDVFDSLAYFFSNYGGALDLRYANFMERPSTGTLVFNDVVFDAKSFHARSTVH